MALQGTLADLGIIDLIQFPRGGRKTGALVITSNNREGRLYYDAGSLIHAVVGDAEGMSALVCMVDWSEGTFEFINETKPAHKTIELDLHRAVMHALKIHDELKAEEERRNAERLGEPKRESDTLSSHLADFISSNEFASHACVISREGDAKAAASAPDGPPRALKELQGVMHLLLTSYPRENFSRAFVVDDEGTVVLTRLRDGSGLIVIAGKEASLGAVSISVGRLASELDQGAVPHDPETRNTSSRRFARIPSCHR